MEWLKEDTWIISDTHLYHKNIQQYCDRPKNHTWLIINNWNNTIYPNEHVLHLGDVILAPKSIMRETYLSGIKHVIPGNHDSRKKLSSLMGFDILPQFIHLEIDGIRLLFSHEPVDMNDPTMLTIWGNDYYNIHGHIHNNPPPKFYGPRHVNLSVEVRDYKPILVSDIVFEIQQGRKT